jgi:hypothetical protein
MVTAANIIVQGQIIITPPLKLANSPRVVLLGSQNCLSPPAQSFFPQIENQPSFFTLGQAEKSPIKKLFL